MVSITQNARKLLEKLKSSASNVKSYYNTKVVPAARNTYSTIARAEGIDPTLSYRQQLQQAKQIQAKGFQSLPAAAKNFWLEGAAVKNNPIVPQRLQQPIVDITKYGPGQFMNVWTKGLAAAPGSGSKAPVLERAGDLLGAAGSVMGISKPFAFAAFSTGINAVQNKINKQPLMKGAGEAYTSGYDLGAKFNAIGSLFVDPVLGPLLTKLKMPALQNINKYWDLAKKAGTKELAQKYISLGVKRILQSIPRETIKGGVGLGGYGATLPAKNREERITNIVNNTIIGSLFGAGSAVVSPILQTVGGQVIKPLLKGQKQLPQPGLTTKNITKEERYKLIKETKDRGAVFDNKTSKDVVDLLKEYDSTGGYPSQDAYKQAYDIYIRRLGVPPNKFANMSNEQIFEGLRSYVTRNQNYVYGSLGEQVPFVGPLSEKEIVAQMKITGLSKEEVLKTFGTTGSTPMKIPQIKLTGQEPTGKIKQIKLATGTETAPQGQVAGTNPSTSYYNYNRLDVTKQGRATAETAYLGLKKDLESVVGRPLTHKEVVKLAKVTNSDLIKGIGREQTAKIAAAQNKLAGEISEMADTGVVSKELLQKMKVDKEFAASTARILEARKAQVGATTAQGRLMTEYLKRIYEVDKDLDKILKRSEGIDWNNAAQVTDFYRSFIKPSAMDWADKLRYNAMLSSPKTQLVNISSNLQGTGILYPIQRTIEGGIDTVWSGLTGKPRTRYTGEGAQYAKGYLGNVGPAWKEFVASLKRQKLSENPDFRNMPVASKGQARMWDDILSSPGTSLEAFDRFFRSLTEAGLRKSLSYRTAKSAGKIPMASQSDITAKAEELLFRGPMKREGEGILTGALGSGAEWVNKAKYSQSGLFRIVAKMTFPFVNIGTNLGKAGLEGNPVLGTVNLIGTADKQAAIAKLIMGGTVTAIGTVMALQDRLTAAAPTDPTKKAAFYDANMRPWSVKIKDKWVSYDKVHPLVGFQLATVATVVDSLKNGNITEDTATKIMKGFANAIGFYADQSYFRNLSDFVSLVNGDSLSKTRLAGNYFGQFIPFRALMGWVTRLVDKYQRQPDTDADFFTKSWQNIAAQIPGLSTTVPARENSFGLPSENENRVLNAFLPFNISTEKPAQKNIYELRQQNYQYNQLKKKIDSLKEKGDYQGALDLINDNRDLYVKGQASVNMINKFNNIKQTIDKINNLPGLTEEKKIEMLKTYEKMMIQMYGDDNVKAFFR